MNDPKFTITIGRQFGSGGREIGKYIANKLNIKYYDKELLAEAAKNTGVKKEFFENADERSPSFLDSLLSFNIGYNSASFFMGSSPISTDNIYIIQSKVIKQLAAENSCVIVGRSADYVLRNEPCCISVFINAPIEERAKRILKRNECSDENEARQFAEKRDKLRASYYNYYTNKIWGAATSYDLSVNSAKLTCEEVGDLIIEYVKMRLQTSFSE